MARIREKAVLSAVAAKRGWVPTTKLVRRVYAHDGG
jgi:hypothetical protein